MKILLVNPPIPFSYYNREYYIPSSLVYLAAVLKQNGEEVKILDLKIFSGSEGSRNSEESYKFYEKKLVNTVAGFKPELIGFGCLYSGQFRDVLRFTELIKKKFKNLPIMLGGIHASIYPREILDNCPSIDWVVIGEGENTIVELVNTVKAGEFKFERINGFAYRKDGGVFINPKSQFIEELDNIPFPAYELIDLRGYYVDTRQWHNPRKLPINTSIPIISSRSCPKRCSFCSMFMVMGPKLRTRSPKNVVDEIEYLYNKYNHRHFSFMDDNFTLKKAHVLEVCSEIIKRNLNIQFETPNGIATSTLDEEVVDVMVKAGLVRIYLAIESGSDYIRNKIMGKNLSRESIFKAVALTRKYKQLYVKAFFIIGMPEETQETLQETYEMIRDVDVDRVYLHNVVPFPGTAVFKQAVRDNLFVDIDPETLYKSDALYITNYARFFIKPYKLELSQLRDFRVKCDRLIVEQRNRRQGPELIKG